MLVALSEQMDKNPRQRQSVLTTLKFMTFVETKGKDNYFHSSKTLVFWSVLFAIFFFFERLSLIYVAGSGIKPKILLPQPPETW
jgi:hypothetical protein